MIKSRMGLFDQFGNNKKRPDPALMVLLEDGQRARADGHPVRALQLFGTLVERAQEQGNVAMEAAALQQRGITWDLTGDSTRAEADVRSAIALNHRLQTEQAHSALRQDFHALGVIFSSRGDHHAAVEAFTESAEWAQKAGEHENADKALIHIALMQHALGQRTEALSRLLETLGHEGPTTVTAAVHVPLLIEWLCEHGRLDEALMVGEQALSQSAHWRNRHAMGRLADDALGAVLEAAADAQFHLSRRLVQAARSREADAQLRLVLRWGEQLGIGGLQEPVAALRAELKLELAQ